MGIITPTGLATDATTSAFFADTRHVADAVATRFVLSPDEILLLNPNTGTLPLFRTPRFSKRCGRLSCTITSPGRS